MAEGAVVSQGMRWYVRTYQSGDETKILELFKRVFGHERSLAHWRWKFLENPAGRQISLAVAEDGGSIIGQFAGLPVMSATPHKTFLLTQGIDHMVEAAWRRQGIYTAMAQHFFENFVTNKGAAAWYAFPVQGGFDIEAKAFSCSALHQVPLLSWDLSNPEPWRPSLQHAQRYRLDHVDRVGPAVDELWNRCRPEFPLATVRDSRYLNWRYIDCPDTQYTVTVVTDLMSERAVGLAIIRFGWFDHAVAPIVDWLVPNNDLDVSRILLTHCHDLAKERGLTAMQASFPSYTPQHRFLVSLGYSVQLSPFILSVHGPQGSEALQAVREGWYYTMGDSDMY